MPNTLHNIFGVAGLVIMKSTISNMGPKSSVHSEMR